MELNKNTIDYAQAKDGSDLLKTFRTYFTPPPGLKNNSGYNVHYLCGNSLGLKPLGTNNVIQEELDAWTNFGVEAHFKENRPWLSYHSLISPDLCRIVGANKEEVVAMGTLTTNLHLLLVSFYRPTKKRYKIIMEAGAFPSDQYTIETQVRLHGFDPADAIIEVAPRNGEFIIEEKDIIKAIHDAGDSLALIMIGGVNYYTGQLFKIEKLTKAAHDVGAHAGFDLAHAVGNVSLQLHEWNVDFGAWCSYKYLNSGPGAIAGIYVHKSHCENPELPQLGGWWGNPEKTRFQMEKGFVPTKTAERFQLSNPSIFAIAPMITSMQLFSRTSMGELRAKSIELTAYLESLLKECSHLPFTIITPEDRYRRGAQLSLLFDDRGEEVFNHLKDHNVICDYRQPNVIRMAPVPLYNSFENAYHVYEVLKKLK